MNCTSAQAGQLFNNQTMKNLLILFLLLTYHLVASSQIYVDDKGYVRYQQPSPQIIHDTIVKTVTVTVKDTVYYCPPVSQPPVVVQPPTQPEVPPPSTGYEGYRKILSMGFNTSAEIPTTQGPRNRLSTDIKTEGAGSFRSEVRSTDQSTSSGYRGEIQYSSSKYKPVEGILEYDVYYENWRAFGGGGHTIQWHPDNGTGSATLCLYGYDGKFQVVRNLGSKYDGANYYQSGTLMSITPNKWYKLRWEFKWATSGGYIRLYIDDKLYYSYNGETMNSSTGMPYLKLGQNRWNMKSGTNTVIYYDNMQLYEKVNPSPSPVPVIDTVPPAKTYQLELTESEANTLLYILNKGKLDGISGNSVVYYDNLKIYQKK